MSCVSERERRRAVCPGRAFAAGFVFDRGGRKQGETGRANGPKHTHHQQLPFVILTAYAAIHLGSRPVAEGIRVSAIMGRLPAPFLQPPTRLCSRQRHIYQPLDWLWSRPTQRPEPSTHTNVFVSPYNPPGAANSSAGEGALTTGTTDDPYGWIILPGTS